MEHSKGKLKQIINVSGRGLSIRLGVLTDTGGYAGKLIASVGDHDIRCADNSGPMRYDWKPDEIKANAAHLVLCWNERDDLVKACKEIQDGPNEHEDGIHLTGDYQTGLFCGLEDCGGHNDPYEACMYGFDKAVERVLEWAQGIVEEAITKAEQS